MDFNLKPIIFFFLFVSLQSYSQNYKFGKVSKEELLEKSYEMDSTVNAVILHDSKKVYYEYVQGDGFQLITEIFQRIKLYNKEGYDFATHKAYLYKQKGNKEDFSGLKAVSYAIKGEKIVETKLKKTDVFETEYSEYYNELKFTMPSLQDGTVIEYQYKIISPFISNIDRIQLQYNIPVKNSKVHVGIPEYMYFNKFTTGYLPINLKEFKENGRIILKSTNKFADSRGSLKGRHKVEGQTIDYKKNVYSIESNNIPAFIKEPYSGNIKNYMSSIVFELASTKFPNSMIKNYSTSWEDVTRTIYEEDDFGGELKKNNYYKEDLALLIQGTTNAQEKAIKIFDFVKNKIKWNGSYGVRTYKGVRHAFKENTGNVAEINLILTSMLQSAGVDANPVVVSTSDRVLSLFPTINGFNYVISRVNLSGKILYLDATDEYGVPNILPSRVVQGMARVIAQNGTSQGIELRPVEPSLERVSLQTDIYDDGSISGKFNVDYLDYKAHSFRVKYGAKNKEDNERRLREFYGFSEITDYEISGVNELHKGVRERFTFDNITGVVEQIDDEMYFSPLLFLRDKENIFKLDERQYPIDFGYGMSNSYMINIKIPENYSIIELPDPKVVKLPDNIGSFSYRIQKNEKVIQLIVQTTINYSLIPAEYYNYIKEFYNLMIEKEGEQVVLKKV